MAKVQPVEVGLLGTINTLKVKYLTGDAEDTTATLFYELSETQEVVNDVNPQITDSVTVKTLSQGNYTLTEEEFEAWGQDNSYLLHLIAGQLGLTLI